MATNYFSYLHYKTCQPAYTKNNIALSHIVRNVTDNKNNQFQKRKDHLLKKKP